MKKRIILLVTLIVGMSSCLKHKAEPIITENVDENCPDSIFFSVKIVDEIITKSCSGCHTNGGTAGGYALDTHSDISAAAEEVLATIKHEYKPMPQGSSKLNDSLIVNFECWISQGKQNN